MIVYYNLLTSVINVHTLNLEIYSMNNVIRHVLTNIKMKLQGNVNV